MHASDEVKTAQRVRFGAGVRNELAGELDRLGRSRALILSTPQQSDVAFDLAAMLGHAVAGIYSKAAMHTPVEITADALSHLNATSADALVAVGGGSTTGLGKALALRTGLPQIAIPTTYAGSEATPILGQTENGRKTTLSDPKVLPDVVLYDPALITGLPREMTVNSALNAMAHAAEALYAQNRTARTDDLAIEGLRSFIDALPSVLDDPRNLQAREMTQRGAWACGAVLGQVGMALHHKLCHTLGGSFDLPHAQTHAVILPHAIHYNAHSVGAALAPVNQSLGGSTPGIALWDFAKSLGAPTALRDLGLHEESLDQAADIATQNPYWNPRDVTRDSVRALLQNAWEGAAPNA